MRALEPFLPATREWFASALGTPTPAQVRAWPLIAQNQDVLLAAPTGQGKTLAAFLYAIDSLIRQGIDGELGDTLSVLYVSPLKALSNDVEKNLRQPLEGIAAALERQGRQPVHLRAEVRTGDTPAHVRTRMIKHPPHVLVTTPESLYILLTSEGGRRALAHVRTVIIDEIHALADDKRGSHLALSLARLDRLVLQNGSCAPTRIGLSATQRPIDKIARFLVGNDRSCAIVDEGHRRKLDIRVEVPDSPMETVLSHEVWEEIFDRLQALIETHKSTLVFTNTRRLTERIAKSLSERLGVDAVTAHHGSLSRQHRLRAEQRLKDGSLRALVATASLEMGIDIGDVDLVCQIGSTRSIHGLLQRIGRASHQVDGVPKGRIFPLGRDELVEAAALMRAIKRGSLDQVEIPEAPIDILAQQVVAAVAAEEFALDELFNLVRSAYPYRELSRRTFDAVVEMLSSGFSTKRGRRGAHLHLDGVGGKLRARRGARLTAITNGGAIPELADYEVVLEPEGLRVGTLNEDFAIESMAGDVFQLGNTSYRIRRVEPGKVRVDDAQGAPPSIPFWLGEAPSRTAELSAEVSELREYVCNLLSNGDLTSSAEALSCELELGVPAARQLVEYIAVGRSALGAVPTQKHLVAERFFDEADNMHIVLHAPFGGRINRAWGLSLRKRFCRTFNFELQAAANEDAIVLSLGPTHSFPVDDVWHFLKSASISQTLSQAVLDSPMFESRWRWNCTRALAVPRFQSGKKVAPALQRMRADDLLTVVFPDQVACAENLQGEREIPDHPLVQETMSNCLHEAMDIEGLQVVLAQIARGEIVVEAKDVKEPSAFASAVLNVRPYAFLDDAPLEERRTQAVLSRRWLDPQDASDLAALDPEAIGEVRDQAWPKPRDADELHDALVLHRGFNAEDAPEHEWSGFLSTLFDQMRAGIFKIGAARIVVAAETLPLWQAAHPNGNVAPALAVPARNARKWEFHEAIIELVRGQLEARGPIFETQLAKSLVLGSAEVSSALASLESEGFAFRLSTAKSAAENQWCERRLLARIHRYTLDRLRKQIEPVSAAAYMRFLCDWQCLNAASQRAGSEGLVAVIEQLQGIEAPFDAWDTSILPARLKDYEPGMLDALCMTGRVSWARRDLSEKTTSPKVANFTFAARRDLKFWLDPEAKTPHPDSRCAHVLEVMGDLGPSYFDDIAEESALLPSQLQTILRELCASGWTHGDGCAGLRAMRVPESRKRARRRSRSSHHAQLAGRWSALRRPAEQDFEETDKTVQTIVRALLRRWGVLFRAVVSRERNLPPWRELLRVLRRLEARGEVRGGRFVAGFAGEQYALPEAVTPLRRARKQRSGEQIVVSVHDPLNLVGLILPGEKIPRIGEGRITIVDGHVVRTNETNALDANRARHSTARHSPARHSPARQEKISDIAEAR